MVLFLTSKKSAKFIDFLQMLLTGDANFFFLEMKVVLFILKSRKIFGHPVLSFYYRT